MARSIEGIYRDGKVELLEPVPDMQGARVLVTFVSEDGSVDLAERGIDPAHAAELRARLKAFEEDWQRPEMDAYDEL